MSPVTTSGRPPAEKPQGGNPDYWTTKGDLLIRIHRRARNRLFAPTGTSDRPTDEDNISDERATTYTPTDAGPTVTIKDNRRVRDNANRTLGSTWKGLTTYKLKKPAPSTKSAAPAPLTGKMTTSTTVVKSTSVMTLMVISPPPGLTIQRRPAAEPSTNKTDTSSPSSDHWEKRGTTWTRHHRMPQDTTRTTLRASGTTRTLRT